MRRLTAAALGLTCLAPSAFAFTPRTDSARFDALAIAPPERVVATRAMSLAELPSSDALRQGWEGFALRHGGWTIALDQRSGLPTLAQGAGIPWIAGAGNSLAPVVGTDPLAQLEGQARQFLALNAELLGEWGSQLQLDRDASGRIGENAWTVTFRQVVSGVKVDGARFDFHVVQGNLVSFGATRWANLSTGAAARVSEQEARNTLYTYLQLASERDIVEDAPIELLLVPVDAERTHAGEWRGARGAGLAHDLVWRFHLHVPGEMATWQADVDAESGAVVALADVTRYDRIKGGVFPLASDGIGPEGTEQPDYPLPYADITVNSVAQPPSNDHGIYPCTSSGAPATSSLIGPYVRISDACGALNQSSTCGADLDLGTSGGTNCVVPAGASPGDTHAARTCFYHVNRIKEKARFWLPNNGWLQGQVQVNTNVNATCNATWSGQLNMYNAGGGCRNTGELAGVFQHELGHGMDANDGGGYDNPTETYADVTAVIESRLSCVGRGFYESGVCGGYGDNCLSCTGIRDQDWDQHASHTPATPQGFASNNCGGGDSPCGREGHCETHIGAEAIFDLATRDLPAAGVDLASAWQLVDRLWYQSRTGSGGNAYNCALPSSDGCGTNSWFAKLRVADDDDGNLANGTPHAAPIYAAFARHGIACGNATDASNQSTSACPALAQPTFTTAINGSGLRLTWNPVANAANYRIYRNELGCDRAQVPIATVAAPATSYLDDDLAAAVTVYYRVQAIGANAACESPVAACQAAAYQPLSGNVRFQQPAYACASTINLKVNDGNGGSGPLTVQVWSDTEQTPELAKVFETAPGSGTYTGSITATTTAPAHGDGKLSVKGGDQLSVAYTDPNTATGSPITTYDASIADCVAATPTSVQITDLTDNSVIVRWSTSEPSTGKVDWGPTTALGSTTQDTTLAYSHAVTLSPLTECARYFFRITANDNYGNSTVLDVGGQPFGFNVGQIPGFFRDSFETSSGWTLEGEWQIGAPQGKGSNDPDPTAAFVGSKVLGHDLTGLGARPGDYEKSTAQRASSPTLNAAGKTGVQLQIRRWLNYTASSTASVEVKVGGGGWQTVWSGGGTFGAREGAWSLQTYDLAPYADNQSSFQVSFKMTASPNNQTASSWNVDRLVVRQASQPQYDACGACGGAPAFLGAATATDADLCSATGGATITWSAATAWGTGHAGSYSVYRDTTPNFTPSAGNRIATGITALTYSDAGATNGQTYYYLVRAENDETCSTGPKNGGVVDGNTAYKSVTLVSSQAVPPQVTGLRVEQPVSSDVRLTWSAAASASTYRLYRSASPLAASFTQRLDATALSANDPGAATDGLTWFYLVNALNACAQQGP